MSFGALAKSIRLSLRTRKPISFMGYAIVLASLVLIGLGSNGIVRGDSQQSDDTESTAENERAKERPTKATAESDSEKHAQLANLLKVCDEIYSGASPEGDEGFAAIRKLGVKTIVSVDGAKPQVALAKQYGLRYVHVPIGYDGVAEGEADQFVAIARTVEHPIYVHCHHGKHRGPAAAAIIAVAGNQIDSKAAVDFLKRAGTDKNYVGLWKDVEAYEAPGENTELPDLVAVAPVRPLAKEMAKIDALLDDLLALQADDWNQRDPSKLNGSQVSLQLYESFYELARESERDERFIGWLNKSSELAGQLKRLADPEVARRVPRAQVDVVVTTLKATCNTCHQAYRN